MEWDYSVRVSKKCFGSFQAKQQAKQKQKQNKMRQIDKKIFLHIPNHQLILVRKYTFNVWTCISPICT